MGGTGLLSGGRPRRGHTVECSSSRVTYCYTVLSPVKSTYTHMHKRHAGNTPLTCDVYEVHESQKKLEAVAGEQKAAKRHVEEFGILVVFRFHLEQTRKSH